MKALIWIIGYLVMTLIYVLTYGVTAKAGTLAQFIEAVLFLAAWIVVSKAMCKKIDQKKQQKTVNAIKAKAAAEGVSDIEIVTRDIPSPVKSICEEHRGNEVALKSFLDNCVQIGQISKAQAMLLLEEYK